MATLFERRHAYLLDLGLKFYAKIRSAVYFFMPIINVLTL